MCPKCLLAEFCLDELSWFELISHACIFFYFFFSSYVRLLLTNRQLSLGKGRKSSGGMCDRLGEIVLSQEQI